MNLLLTLALFVVPALAAEPKFHFAKEQAVYVVCVKTNTRDLSLTREDLELERRVKNEFKKRRAFKVNHTLRGSDFVFFVLLDSASGSNNEIALAVTPVDYEKFGSNLDALRNAALWQADNHLKSGRHAALAMGTMGLSAIFDHPSVVTGLVKQFHEDTLR